VNLSDQQEPGNTSFLSVRLFPGIEEVECNGETAHDHKVHPTDPGEVLEEQNQQDNDREQDIQDTLHLSNDLYPVPGCLAVGQQRSYGKGENGRTE